MSHVNKHQKDSHKLDTTSTYDIYKEFIGVGTLPQKVAVGKKKEES
jgi:hypothetical protein